MRIRYSANAVADIHLFTWRDAHVSKLTRKEGDVVGVSTEGGDIIPGRKKDGWMNTEQYHRNCDGSSIDGCGVHYRRLKIFKHCQVESTPIMRGVSEATE